MGFITKPKTKARVRRPRLLGATVLPCMVDACSQSLFDCGVGGPLADDILAMFEARLKGRHEPWFGTSEADWDRMCRLQGAMQRKWRGDK